MAGELLTEAMASAMASVNSAMIGDQSQNGDGQQLRQKQQAPVGYPATVLPFPSNFSSDPVNSLAPLRDNHSDYNAVSKTCLLLNQFAANGSSKAAANAANTSCGSMDYVESSSLFHDPSFAHILSESFAALLECIREHHDRRCRVIACKTVAVVARAAYARLRKSPHTTTGMRDDANNNIHVTSNTSSSHENSNASMLNTADGNYTNRLDDEVGTDVPMALCTAALEDADDGVAATALSSLGTMILSTTPAPGTLNDDELWTEVRAISQIGQQPYAPSIRQLLDEDSTTQQSELQVRVLENVICPRLMQLVSRFLVLNHPSHVAMMLPVLTASLVYLSKTTVPVNNSSNGDSDGTNSNSVMRRTSEQSDCNALIEMVVDGILLPWMQESTITTMGATLTAALSSIRLIHACPMATWVKEVSHWAIAVLKEECRNTSACLEAQLPILATLVVLSRVVPLFERVDAILEFVIDRVLELPSTTMTPSGTVSAGLLLELDKLHPSSTGVCMDQYRKPTRPAFWAEVALGFFMDGPLESNTGNKIDSSRRSKALVKFLECSKIVDILGDRSNDDTAIGTYGKIREELVTSFCMVAFQVGRRHKSPSESTRGTSTLMARRDELEEWIQLSLAVLNGFSTCVGWGVAPLYMDEEITMLVASQAAYTRLLQEVLHAAGLLNANSITLKMTSITSPPHLLWDQTEEDSEYLLRFDPMPLMENTTETIARLIDDLVKKEMKGAGIVSHHMRLLLMSLATDQWIQARHATMKSISSSSSEIAMSVDSAKQLLVTVSPRRMFGKVVESNKRQIENYSNVKKEKYKKYAQDTVSVCVACIESMALMACYYTKKFGSSNDAKAVLNYSVKSLQGKVGNDSDSLLPMCQGAIERIQSAFQNSDTMVLGSISSSPLVPAEFKRRSIISNSRITQGRDAFNEGYITQLSRQIISSRVDRCLYSFPHIHNLSSTVRKQNWLRLALPPLPQSRNPNSSLTLIPKFKWGSNIAICTAGSDPAAVTLAYYLRRNMRYDGEDEFRLMITMRVDNLTAVEIPNGLRLGLGITEENTATSTDAQDAVSLEISKSLAEGQEQIIGENTFGSSMVTYKRGLKGGDHISWDIMMNPLPMTGSLSLNPSIVFRALDKEMPHSAWVSTDTQKKDGEETSMTSGGSKGGSVGADDNQSKQQKENVSITCEPVTLPPMIGLQPCPLVFFRDSLGDVESFQFLWSRMPCQLTPFKLVTDPSPEEMPARLYDAMRLATISSVKFKGDRRPGGIITHLWAFMNPRGKRAMFVLGEQDENKVLHARGDDKLLLFCLLGTNASRSTLISALKPGLKQLHKET